MSKKYKGLQVLPHTTYDKVFKYIPLHEERQLRELDNYHTEIKPVFNRVGCYLYEGLCWFEVRGRAFEYRNDLFEYEMRQLNMGEVDNQVVNNLIAIQRLSPSLLTKKQLLLISDYKTYLNNRRHTRLSRKRIHELRARITAFKLKEGLI